MLWSGWLALWLVKTKTITGPGGILKHRPILLSVCVREIRPGVATLVLVTILRPSWWTAINIQLWSIRVTSLTKVYERKLMCKYDEPWIFGSKLPLPFRICDHMCCQHVQEVVIDNTAVIDSITISSTSSIIYAKIIVAYTNRHAYSVSMISKSNKNTKRDATAASFWCWFECILFSINTHINTIIHSYLLSMQRCAAKECAQNGVLTVRLYPHATDDTITKSLDLAFCGTGPSSISYPKSI